MKFIKITKDNADVLNNTPRATVLVYHPGCIHCVMMRKAWEDMKKKIEQERRNCNIYELSGEDIGSIEATGKKYQVIDNVNGFPSIMNTTNGNVTSMFNKERNIDNMLDFVLENEERMSIPKKRVTFKITNKLQNSIKKIRKTLGKKTNGKKISKRTTKKSKPVPKKGKKAKKGKSRGKK
jgi:hypothetical protein